jgi:hypothetical protein
MQTWRDSALLSCPEACPRGYALTLTFHSSRIRTTRALREGIGASGLSPFVTPVPSGGMSPPTLGTDSRFVYAKGFSSTLMPRGGRAFHRLRAGEIMACDGSRDASLSA